jgi:NhaP-type Na+/H+ or K+/H+ antiporter
LAFGSLISATDPVCIMSAFRDFSFNNDILQIVYGESILNDAISIVFYQISSQYNKKDTFLENFRDSTLGFFLIILGSTIIGLLVGFLTAIFLKIISSKVKRIERIELGLMIILPWISYLTAQVNLYKLI